jgi:predicted alternative tryptophan synthase beta-subunit
MPFSFATVSRVLLFNLSGHGLLDLSSYESYPTSKIQDG